MLVENILGCWALQIAWKGNFTIFQISEQIVTYKKS